jgi:hypothetical protein
MVEKPCTFYLFCLSNLTMVFLLMQYGPVAHIDLKIPPRPPGYAFVEVSFGNVLYIHFSFACGVSSFF